MLTSGLNARWPVPDRSATTAFIPSRTASIVSSDHPRRRGGARWAVGRSAIDCTTHGSTSQPLFAKTLAIRAACRTVTAISP
jgi:hypothetical protein